MLRQLQSRFCCPALDQLVTAGFCGVAGILRGYRRLSDFSVIARSVSSLYLISPWPNISQSQQPPPLQFLDYCAFLWGRPDDTRVSAPRSALAETDGNFISAAAAAVQPLKHSTTFTSSVAQKQKEQLEGDLKCPNRYPSGTLRGPQCGGVKLGSSLLTEINVFEGDSQPRCISVNTGQTFLREIWK